MSRVQIDLEGLEKLRGKLKDPTLIRKPLKKLIYHAAGIGKKQARESIDGGTGIALRSIAAIPEATEATVFSKIAQARAMSIEVGRKPGEEVPFMALARWLTGRQRSFAPTREERKTVIQVQALIKARGAKGKAFIKTARETVNRNMPRLVSEMARKIEEAWRK
jgi:hypothetical protein